jgi:hypothetical protein
MHVPMDRATVTEHQDICNAFGAHEVRVPIRQVREFPGIVGHLPGSAVKPVATAKIDTMNDVAT